MIENLIINMSELKDRFIEDTLIGYVGGGIDKSLRIKVYPYSKKIEHIVYNKWREEQTIFNDLELALTYYNSIRKEDEENV